MTTGTNGNDVLTNDVNVRDETLTALGGDDLITIQQPTGNTYGIYSTIAVDGGDGFDQLTLNASQFSYLTTNGSGGHLSVRVSSNFGQTVDWTGIERLVLSGNLFPNNTTGYPASNQPSLYETGSTIDILNLTQVYAGDYTVRTNDGDDQIVFSRSQNPNTYPTGVAIIDAGRGDDLIDLSGASLQLSGASSPYSQSAYGGEATTG